MPVSRRERCQFELSGGVKVPQGVIQVPPSYNKTLSKAIRLFLEMQGIDLLEGDVWGHRKDIDEYYVVEEGAIEQIGNLITGGESIDVVASQVQMNTRLSPDLIKYIAKSKMTA